LSEIDLVVCLGRVKKSVEETKTKLYL